MKTKLILSSIVGWAIVSPLSAATVEAVKGGASAKAAQALPPGSSFATKKSSQSQIRLDKGFVRLGSNSQFQVGKDDQVNLKQGVMMVGSDGARKRGTVKVTAPGYNFQVQGTALIAYQPGSYIKITVLEGRIRVALQSLLGEFETLEAGQMLVINPADKRLPDPVEVDLNRLVTTSVLTAGGALGPAPTDPFIQASASGQGGEVNDGMVTRTPFSLRGASPEVTVFQLVNDLDDPNAIVGEKNYLPPGGDTTSLSNVTITRQGAKTRTMRVNMRSRLENDGSTTLPTISGNVTVAPDVYGGSPQKLNINADDTLLILPGANVSTPANTALEIEGRALDIQNATLKAGNGTQASEGLSLGAFGSDSTREFDIGVKGSTLEAGTVEARGALGGGNQRIGIDSSTVTAPKGITLGTSTAPTTITVRNSSQIAALAGSIKFDSGGRAILVDNSTLMANATTGQIVLDAGETGDVLTLRNSNLNADVIKARGHSASGDAVIVDGGSFVARTVLKFYAAGASMLRFRGNVVIDSPRSIFSARAVQVDLGGTVTSTGIVDIFVNPGQDNFNKPGFGTITTRTNTIPGGTAPNVLPYNSPDKPGF
ncbi:FecR domain-containing protein [Brevifollis gellanilyticus]|uniref:FecR protein domain-containing protein n=1 Tax=Brevifollis gellanilyticus TaxID=748831 RepID=A0A512MCV8_9BACT|nr:FecR domain-containing protein [Brevifollis gellanilyticus]GEP44574.1 hypothetical protein BGE01nite_38650 [Brevifollis gellanilyticus]